LNVQRCFSKLYLSMKFMRRLLCPLKYNFQENMEENFLIIYDRSLHHSLSKWACRVKESSSPSHVHFNPVSSQHVLAITLLNSQPTLSASTRENHSSFCDLSVTLQNKLNTKQSSIHYTVLKTRQLGMKLG